MPAIAMNRTLPGHAPVVVVTLAALLAAAPASAQDRKKECATAYEQVQGQRKDGHLRAARERALACSQESCQDFVRKDCARWLTEIEESLPTVVFEARDKAGKETTDVRVTMDGELLKEHLDGKAVEVDPGEHVFKYELAGVAPIEEKTLIREGDKVRKLAINFKGGGGEADAPEVPGGETHAGPPAAAFVLGGVGLVGVGMFATFGILGRNEKSDLESSCAPNCTDDQVSSVRTKLIVADISLAAGVVALGVATYLFIATPSKHRAASRRASPLVVGSGPGQVGGSIGARF